MAESSASGNIPLESQADNSPAKHPALTTASLEPAQDDGSDFYNTPLVANTPTQAAPSEECNPAQSVPQIPGLSLCYEGQGGAISTGQTNNATSGQSEQKDAAVNPVPIDQSAESNDADVSNSNVQPENLSSAAKDDVEMEEPSREEPPTVAQGTNEETQQQTVGEEVSTAANNANGDAQPAQAESTDRADPPNAVENAMDILMGENEGDEHPEWEVDSSPYESSSDSSDSSDDSSDDDVDYPLLDPEEQARILMLAEGGSDDEGDRGRSGGGYVRTVNERPEEIVPKPDVTVTPEMKIVPLGNVTTVVENVALITAKISGEYQVLESGSVLCLEDRSVIGVVSETLGRVEQPLYTVRFPTEAAVAESGAHKDAQIFYVESHSTFVFTQPLKSAKGSDASNFHDEEVADEEIEFSDDEAEADYKRKLKQKRQEKRDARSGNHSAKSGRGPHGPSKLGTTELNYDDDGPDEGYTPLARPQNLHEMMGHQEAPVEGQPRGEHSDKSFRGSRGRGRGRGRGGHDRGRGQGRGGRGSGGRGRDRGWDSHHQHGEGRDQRDSYPPQSDRGASYPPQSAPGYQQPAYPQQQSFPSFQQYPQQAFNPPAAQSFQTQQFGFQGANNSFQGAQPGAFINPAFFPGFQQPQPQPQQNAQQPTPGQNLTDPFALLRILQQVSGANGQNPANQGSGPTN